MKSKENIFPGNKNNRTRGENWTQEEKDLFMEIMRQSAPIIECKLTDTNTNKKKTLEWIKVQKSLRELTGKSRDIAQLKGFWRRSKLAAKKTVSQHRRALQATGGGQRLPSPDDDHLKIMELCPTDFVLEENIYDSDAVSQLTSEDNNQDIVIGGTEGHNSTIYDLDEDEILPAEDPAVRQIITVANVHSEEVEDEILPAEEPAVQQFITVAKMHSEEIDIKIPKCSSKTKMVFSPKVDKKQDGEKKTKKFAGKETLLRSNLEFKEQASAMLEEEHRLKIKYQEQELAHQQLRHKLEIDILLLEKDTKKIELELLKKN